MCGERRDSEIKLVQRVLSRCNIKPEDFRKKEGAKKADRTGAYEKCATVLSAFGGDGNRTASRGKLCRIDDFIWKPRSTDDRSAPVFRKRDFRWFPGFSLLRGRAL